MIFLHVWFVVVRAWACVCVTECIFSRIRTCRTRSAFSFACSVNMWCPCLVPTKPHRHCQLLAEQRTLCTRDWSVRALVERHGLWPVPAAVRRCEWVSSVPTDAANARAQQFTIPHTVPRVPSWPAWNGVPALRGVTGQGAALCAPQKVTWQTRG